MFKISTLWYDTIPTYLPFIDLGCVSKVMVSRKGGLCNLHCFQMRPRDAAASKKHWLMVLKPNLVIVCSLPPFRSWSPKTFVYIICFDSTFLPVPTCCSPKDCPFQKRYFSYLDNFMEKNDRVILIHGNVGNNDLYFRDYFIDTWRWITGVVLMLVDKSMTALLKNTCRCWIEYYHKLFLSK